MAHVQGHLAAQDVLLTRIAGKIGLDPVPIIDNPPAEESADTPGPVMTVRETAGPESTGPKAAGPDRRRGHLETGGAVRRAVAGC